MLSSISSIFFCLNSPLSLALIWVNSSFYICWLRIFCWVKVGFLLLLAINSSCCFWNSFFEKMSLPWSLSYNSCSFLKANMLNFEWKYSLIIAITPTAIRRPSKPSTTYVVIVSDSET